MTLVLGNPLQPIRSSTSSQARGSINQNSDSLLLFY
ncbi:unnamed protein product [Amoebophrya sp. A25]|nr:unnamed protein product [Amoebophrya sp. A25]|eukprot:GSA25T00022040001.1